ncbi:MAG TPA: S9 family peptidase [Acidobacteriaceae bacterium]|jgi:dipeptidyl aminopeptidase/acylaminoacyl peptidase|nr:S9 family peptidase [Acidobacteriaceae bacterium]
MRKLLVSALLSAACLAVVPVAHAADENHFPSNEDLRHVRSIAEPKLSPDGQRVLLQVSDATADGGKSHLWLIDVKDDTARQLTYSPASEKRGESAGAWMPDGESILFLAHRGEHTELYRLPMNGGEAHAFDVKIVPPVDESKESGAIPPAKNDHGDNDSTKSEPVEADIARYFVAPDGKTIAILIRDPETPGEKKEHDEKADAVNVDQSQHGTRLYLLDAQTGKLTKTAVLPNVERVAWAEQSDRLLALCEPMHDEGDISPGATAWILTASDPDHPKQITSAPKTIGSASWSPDEHQVYFLAQAKADAPPGYSDLYALTLADGAVRDLSDGFDGSVGRGTPIVVGDAVLEAVETGTHTTIARFVGGRHELLHFDTGTVTQLNTNARRTGWVWIGASSDRPPALFYAGKPGQEPTLLKTPDLVPTAWTPVHSQLVSWKDDNLTIEGLLYLPPQAEHHKVPLIVDVHGGPTGAWEDSWIPITQFLIGQGWAVLRPNPRGSTGRGAAFAAANRNDMGGGDYRDIMAGVDTVIAKYPVDPDKLALIGYSYGGEMAGFVEGRTDRFKAIVAGAPVIDQESEYGTEDGSWYDRWFYGGHPWEHPESAWRQSPLADAAKAKTPFLLLQGESDKTDPLGQSEEMYRALRQMGVPVEFVEYPREDHGPLAGGIFGMPSPEPWHGFDGRQRIVTFIRKGFGE